MAFDCRKNPRSYNSGTTQIKGKAPMPMPSYTRPRSNIGHTKQGSYGSFEDIGSKGASGSKVSWWHPKDANADFKRPSKSHISDKKAKFSTFGFKSESNKYDSWDKAKDKLIADENNKHRWTNACINCGEVSHKFSDYPKPKPCLLASVIHSLVPIT